MRPIKVLFFATNVRQYNGYSYAIYELACQIAKKKDIQITIYGFQNFYDNASHVRSLPPNVYEYDAWLNENPKQQGFGFDKIVDFVKMNQPDICIVYNDAVVVSNVISQLYKVPNKTFKIAVYIDQVYLHQKKEYITFLNEKVDFVLAFTPYWETCVIEQGLKLPTDYLQHGFNSDIHYPVPKALARRFYNIKEDELIILNLNRNQPRKRWDVCLQAFAEIVKRHLGEPVKLLIATATQGAWPLIDVYERELNKRGVSLSDGMKHIILIDNPQQLTDEDVNILYNIADIGINTCDGEGFGLCNFQQAAIGIPQIVPAIGGFLDFFNDENSMMINPVVNLYIDTSRDGVGGESQVCSYVHFADAIDRYIKDPELRTQHGKNARQHILKNYRWEDLGERLYSIIKRIDNLQKEQNITNTTEQPNIETLDNSTTISLLDIEEALQVIEGENKIKKLKTEDSKTNIPNNKISKLLKAKQKSKQYHKKK